MPCKWQSILMAFSPYHETYNKMLYTMQKDFHMAMGFPNSNCVCYVSWLSSQPSNCNGSISQVTWHDRRGGSYFAGILLQDQFMPPAAAPPLARLSMSKQFRTIRLLYFIIIRVVGSKNEGRARSVAVVRLSLPAESDIDTLFNPPPSSLLGWDEGK